MLQQNSWVAVVGPFLFPWGQPGSRRVCGIARSLADAGYRVIVGSGGTEPATLSDLNEGEHPGSISHVGLGELPPSETSALDKSLQIFVYLGKKTVAWLEAQTSKPSHVISYGGNAQYMYQLSAWCRRNKVPLIVDVVEWYDGTHMSGGRFGPFHISAEVAFHYFYPKSDGIIAISSYLVNHFRQHKSSVICIPPTLDVNEVQISPNAQPSEVLPISLVYAGSPGKKDLLANVIHGMNQIDPQGQHFRLKVVGPSEAQVKSLLKLDALPAFVHVLGRVPQTEISSILQQADFSVLLREPLRFAQAGFPTKFVESMSNGTPVIANITSDLGNYLHDGIEGFIARDHSPEAFAEVLKRVMQSNPSERKNMRVAARKQAEKSFDFRNYVNPIKHFLDGIKV
jgi:glycosyltransferase involved in cell wall biosynthesis